MHSLEIIQWDSTRRDCPGYFGRVSGSGPVSRPMVAGWGISPLLLLRWYPPMEPSIKPPILILYPFSRAYKIMASVSLTEHNGLVGIITEAMK